MRKTYYGFLASVFLISSITLTACGSTPVNYTTADKNTNEKTLTAQVSAEPDSVETDENGMKMVTYDKSEYGDYTGKMVYYFLEDKLMMSRWETSCDDVEERNEIYHAISKKLSTELNQEGKENEEKNALSWSTDDKDVSLGFTTIDGKPTVYLLENLHEIAENEKQTSNVATDCFKQEKNQRNYRSGMSVFVEK